MNKGAKVRRKFFCNLRKDLTACDSKRAEGFTEGRIYRIKAGRGDATAGLGNNLCGAFILNETQMVLTDDYGVNRQVAFDERFWELVEDCENLNPIRQAVEVYKPRAGTV